MALFVIIGGGKIKRAQSRFGGEKAHRSRAQAGFGGEKAHRGGASLCDSLRAEDSSTDYISMPKSRTEYRRCVEQLVATGAVEEQQANVAICPCTGASKRSNGILRDSDERLTLQYRKGRIVSAHCV